MNPEEAVQAHLDVNGRLLVPIHWCTFRLAPHPWAEPIERLLAAADASQVSSSGAKAGRARGPNGHCTIRALVATRGSAVRHLHKNSYEEGRNMGFLDKAKDLLAQNADKVDAAIDKAGEFVDSKTEGKYKDTVSKVQEAAKNALDDGEKG